MVGLIIGIFGFSEIYPVIYDFAWSGDLGTQTLPGLFGLPSWIVAIGVTGMALGLFWLAEIAERKFRDSQSSAKMNGQNSGERRCVN